MKQFRIELAEKQAFMFAEKLTDFANLVLIAVTFNQFLDVNPHSLLALLAGIIVTVILYSASYKIVEGF